MYLLRYFELELILFSNLLYCMLYCIYVFNTQINLNHIIILIIIIIIMAFQLQFPYDIN